MQFSDDVLKLLKLAVNVDSTVLITGCTGTGKTCLASQIHERSKRRNKPFVEINLATMHEGTLESELFGYERGAFTGAGQKRIGKLEMAEGGTVFLDEVGELPLTLQARLLGFLQSKTIHPIGSNRKIHLDVRIIAATHKNLAQAVAKNEFREDLLHRLRVIAINLKCLKQRMGELDAIVERCLSDICQKSKRGKLGISRVVMDRFKTHQWAGNIRELVNVLEFASHIAEGDEIVLSDLPEWFLTTDESSSVELTEKAEVPVLGTLQMPLNLSYYESVSFFEKEFLSRALVHCRGRVNRTASRIGLSKSTLIRKMRIYNLKNE